MTDSTPPNPRPSFLHDLDALLKAMPMIMERFDRITRQLAQVDLRKRLRDFDRDFQSCCDAL